MSNRTLGPPRPGDGLPNKKYPKRKKTSSGLYLSATGAVWATCSGMAKLAGLGHATMNYRFKKYGMTAQTGIPLDHDRTASRYHAIHEHTAEVLGVDWQKILDWKAEQQ